MTGAKFDIKKFDRTGDFRLWRIQMHALLIQHGCEAALEVLPEDMEAQVKIELNKKAHSALILCLGNKVLREEKGDDGEGLYVRGRTDRRDSRQSRGKSRSKSQGGRLKCYICQSEDHLKRNCPKNNRKKSTGYVKKDEQPSSSGSTYDDSEVMMVMTAQALLDWIMDLGCSYHMTPRLDILFDFLECDGGRVQVGDNRECKIRGIDKVRIQLRDGSSFVLHNGRYIPELKRNLISLGTLEKKGFTVKLQSGKVKSCAGLAQKTRTYQRGGTTGAGKAGDVWQEKSRFKHEAFGKFKEWKQLVENQEYEQLCIESGIARHLTVVGTPQQNGVA
ncbi:retrovirus-related pol polyprotein from transposon TNT 1-94 [Tanacetum coccineum]